MLVSTERRPPWWSRDMCVATTSASRRTPARRSRRTTPASGGPPSNRIAVPSGCWTSVASPWPTSRKRTVRAVGGPGGSSDGERAGRDRRDAGGQDRRPPCRRQPPPARAARADVSCERPGGVAHGERQRGQRRVGGEHRQRRRQPQLDLATRQRGEALGEQRDQGEWDGRQATQKRGEAVARQAERVQLPRGQLQHPEPHRRCDERQRQHVGGQCGKRDRPEAMGEQRRGRERRRDGDRDALGEGGAEACSHSRRSHRDPVRRETRLAHRQRAVAGHRARAGRERAHAIPDAARQRSAEEQDAGDGREGELPARVAAGAWVQRQGEDRGQQQRVGARCRPRGQQRHDPGGAHDASA